MVRKSWNVPQLFLARSHSLNGADVAPEPPRCRLWGSVRLTYTLAAFLSMVFQMAMRNMLSLSILRMVKPRPEDAFQQLVSFNMTSQLSPCATGAALESDIAGVVERSGDLAWTRSQELAFPGTFYYGYVITLPLAGRLADKFGGKLLFISAIKLQALAFIALPFMAHHSYGAAVAMLVIMGMLAGCGNPPIYQLFVIWAHPTERTALLSFAFSGIIMGTMMIYPVASALSDYSWELPFYVIGGLSLLFGVSCYWLIYDSLDHHPRLTPAEKEYLQPKEQQQHSQQLSMPWTALLTSMPVYAFIVTHIFHNYGFIVLSLVMPRFLREAMQFSLKEIGFLSSAPHLGSLLSKLLCVMCCGYVEKRAGSNLTWMRRILYATCNTITICSIGAIIYASCEQKALVVSIYVLLGVTTDLGFSGGYWPTLLGFAPSYAGLVSGVANCFAHLCGFLAPYPIAAMVQTGSKAEWNLVLVTLMVFYGLGVIVFCSCSSSTLQPWDARSTKADATTKKRDIKVSVISS